MPTDKEASFPTENWFDKRSLKRRKLFIEISLKVITTYLTFFAILLAALAGYALDKNIFLFWLLASCTVVITIVTVLISEGYTKKMLQELEKKFQGKIDDLEHRIHDRS